MLCVVGSVSFSGVSHIVLDYSEWKCTCVVYFGRLHWWCTRILCIFEPGISTIERKV